MRLRFKKSKFNLLLPRILDFIASLDEGKEYDLEIKQLRKKRSLNANNYSWKLTDELADKLILAGVKLSKEEVHAEMIYRYGQVMCNEDGEPITISVLKGVKVTDFYPYAKEIGSGTVKGKEFTHYRIYRGSHTYDTREMSIFISGIVEECKEQGIDTDTEEIKSLLGVN